MNPGDRRDTEPDRERAGDTGSERSDGPGATQTSEEAVRDLGFGSRVASEPWVRLLNRDGSYNLVRKGIPRMGSVSVYGALHRIDWWQFYLLIAAGYLIVNLLFAGAYWACGTGALEGTRSAGGLGRFLEAFFFSVETLTTVGYGNLAPAGLAANIIASAEALLGLGGFAVVAALFFARLARPRVSVRFSDHAVIAPYQEDDAFEFRMVNVSRQELIEVEVELVYTYLEERGGEVSRRFRRLELERDRIAFFPLHWTVVHPIGPSSPLRDKGKADLIGEAAEFLVQVRAIDEAHVEAVRARTSYRADEIEYGRRFADIYERTAEGILGIDVDRVGELMEG